MENGPIETGELSVSSNLHFRTSLREAHAECCTRSARNLDELAG